ncbi:MAG TPA: hypothetical protein VNV38_14990 [Stellaceae bacterium]|jgi:hypothetical protein|nr:hypothetical protein [Stellaceae bacterium]
MKRTILILAAAAAIAIPALAQQKMNMPGMNMPAASKSMPGMDMDEVKSNAPYHPGLGDLMTAFIQPRHTKLGLAGQAQNWDYAAYELGELKEAFDDVGKMILKHSNLQIAPAIAATVTPAMDAVDKAITAKDPAAFTKAYADLTDACNACHKSADHPMIVIQVPSAGTAFPDQNFNPPPK